MPKSSKLPSLSVVVPMYNEASHINQCLERLLDQQKDLLEILVVDNNSSDNSVEIVQPLAQQHKIIKLLRQPTQGLIPSRNLGFTTARGQVVARIDADTQVAPGWAAAIRQSFAKQPDIAALDGQTRYYDLPFENFSAYVSKLVVTGSNKFAGGTGSLLGPNMAIRTDIAKQLTKLACTNRKMMEDLDLTIHIRRLGGKIERNEAMLAYISGRRLGSNPWNFWHYSKMWPNTYAIHGKRLAKWLTMAIVILGIPGQALIFLPVRAFDPDRRTFSWKYLRGHQGDRINP